MPEQWTEGRKEVFVVLMKECEADVCFFLKAEESS